MEGGAVVAGLEQLAATVEGGTLFDVHRHRAGRGGGRPGQVSNVGKLCCNPLFHGRHVRARANQHLCVKLVVGGWGLARADGARQQEETHVIAGLEQLPSRWGS